MRRLLVLVIVLIPARAFADPPAKEPAPPEIVSPEIAATLSVGTTLLGIGMMVAGDDSTTRKTITGTGIAVFFVGPSVGHWYARDGWNNALTARLVGTGLLAIGFSQFELFGDGGNDGLAAIGIVGGGGLYVVASLVEIGTAPSAARRYNRSRARSSLRIAPTASRDGAGVALRGSF